MVFFFHLAYLLILTFICNWFGLLFVDCATMFVTLKGRKWCWPFKFLFWDAINVVTFLTMDKNKISFYFMSIWHYLSILFFKFGLFRLFRLFTNVFIINIGLFLFKILQEISVICFHNLVATILKLYFNFFKIKFVLLVKICVWSM